MMIRRLASNILSKCSANVKRNAQSLLTDVTERIEIHVGIAFNDSLLAVGLDRGKNCRRYLDTIRDLFPLKIAANMRANCLKSAHVRRLPTCRLAQSEIASMAGWHIVE